MIWIDFVITGLALLCVLMGAWRGFSHEIFAIFSWISAITIGLNFDKDFVRFAPSIGDKPATQLAGSFIALCLISLALAAAIGFLLKQGNDKSVGFFSRLGGLIMGGVRSLITITILVMLAGLTSLPKDPWWQESKLLPPFQLLAVGLRDHVSSGIAGYINYR